jgi:hypothetical protein
MMPQASPAIREHRELNFYEEGILSAITCSLRSAAAFGLPPMPPQRVKLLPSEGKVSVIYGSGATAKSVMLDAKPLGALLVSFCIRSKIPMPKHVPKEVRVELEYVVLAFAIEHICAPPPQVNEPIGIQNSEVRSWAWGAP